MTDPNPLREDEVEAPIRKRFALERQMMRAEPLLAAWFVLYLGLFATMLLARCGDDRPRRHPAA